MYGLQDKRVLLTGGASGIGRRIATRMAEEGCIVGIIDIDDLGAEETVATIAANGGRAVALAADVTDAGQLAEAHRRFGKAFGDVDILINNAGVTAVGKIGEFTLEQWRKTFQINVESIFSLCTLVVPELVRKRGGRIINTASWFGKVGKSHYGAYCASKFAVIGFTQSLAAELAPMGVTVNAVCPGTIVETAMRDVADRLAIDSGLRTAKQRESDIPMGRVGLPDDVARVVAFLASNESSYMTGQALNVTGGLWMH